MYTNYTHFFQIRPNLSVKSYELSVNSYQFATSRRELVTRLLTRLMFYHNRFNKPSILVSRLQITKKYGATVLGMARKRTQSFGNHGNQNFGEVFWPYQAQ